MTSVVIEDVSVVEVVLGGEAVMSGLLEECPHSRDGVSFPKPGPGWEVEVGGKFAAIK